MSDMTASAAAGRGLLRDGPAFAPAGPTAVQSAGREGKASRNAVAGLQVAYLINTYPKISHSFIATEIEAIERRGFAIRRFTFRRTGEVFEEEAGRSELERTTCLLERGIAGIALDCAAHFLARPAAATGALCLSFRSSGIGNLHRAIACFAEASTLARILRREGVKHVHAHFGTNSAAVARLVARLVPVTYSFTVHGPEEFDAPVALDLAGKISDAAFVCGVSSFGRGQLMRWAPHECWPRLQVVRCAVSPTFLEEGAGEARNPANARLLCVARLDGQKGLPLLIEAAARVAAKRDFVLEIYGDGPRRALIESQIESLGLGESVRLLGWGTPEQIRCKLERSRAFVLPSFAEGLPVVLMEALALCRPVIATAIAGVPELVDSECGWLIPSGSVDDLAVAMQSALDAGQEELETMGKAGRRRVMQMHHPERIAAQLADLFEARIGATTV